MAEPQSSPLPENHISAGSRAYDPRPDEVDSSVFPYDVEHPTSSTYPSDKNFKPVDSDLPPATERRLSKTRHSISEEYEGPGFAKLNDEVAVHQDELKERRRNSILAETKRRPARKATGSFGPTDEEEHLQQQQQPQPGLFFAGGIPTTTSSSVTGEQEREKLLSQSHK